MQLSLHGLPFGHGVLGNLEMVNEINKTFDVQQT